MAGRLILVLVLVALTAGCGPSAQAAAHNSRGVDYGASGNYDCTLVPGPADDCIR